MSKRKSQDEGDIPLSSRVQASFRHDIIKDVLKTQYSNQKNKISDEALDMVTQITKIMVVEATARAARQASMENRSTITLEHIENILPQMCLPTVNFKFRYVCRKFPLKKFLPSIKSVRIKNTMLDFP